MSERRNPLIFGEVLFDRFPDGSEISGGAPFNVAWNLRGLGLDPLLVSRVGQDELGERILAAMREFGLDQGGIQRDPEHATGTVEVDLEDGEPRFEIVEDRAYDFIDPDQLPADRDGERGRASLVYHGSLALRSPASAAAARAILAHARELELPTQVFFDVNLRPPWWRREQIDEYVSYADHIKLNEDELGALVPEGRNFEDRARQLLDRSRATAVYVTRGAQGAWARMDDGSEYSTHPTSSTQVVDSVGAGDAFSSVLILGILQDWPAQSTMDRAQEFAGGVVGLRGATTTDSGFYSRYLKMWGIS